MAGNSDQRFCLYSPPVDFVENRLPQYHEAFNHPHMRFDSASNRFVDTSPPATMYPRSPQFLLDVPNRTTARQRPPEVNEMAFWSSILPKAMDRLVLLHNPIKDGGIRGFGKWEDIQDRLACAKRSYEFADYESTAGQKGGKVRKWARKVMDKSTAPLQQVAKLVPDTAITSPITGSMKMVIDAYQTAASSREEINSNIENLPSAFRDIDFNVGLFPDDPNIEESSIKLVLAILKATELAIAFYSGYQIDRAMKALWKGDDYEKALKSSLEEISHCKTSLKEEASKSEVHYQHSSQEKQGEGVMKMLSAINYFLMLLNSGMYRLDNVERELRSRPSTPQPNLLPTYRPEDFWNLFNIPRMGESDLDEVFRRGGGLLPEDRCHAEDVVKTRQFTQWVVDRDMKKLLIHGDFESAGPISPLSVLCASLTKALRTRDGYISLAFVCGRHLANDEYPGPTAMIHILLGQLLEQYPVCPDMVINQVDVDRVRKGDIEELCKLFAGVARQVPREFTIFCMIDGIQFYERHPFMDGMEEVLCSVLELAEGTVQGLEAVMKVLLTSPKGTTKVRELFERDVSLVNMAAIPHSEQVTSQRHFEQGLGRTFPNTRA